MRFVFSVPNPGRVHPAQVMTRLRAFILFCSNAQQQFYVFLLTNNKRSTQILRWLVLNWKFICVWWTLSECTFSRSLFDYESNHPFCRYCWNLQVPKSYKFGVLNMRMVLLFIVSYDLGWKFGCGFVCICWLVVCSVRVCYDGVSW
jgi:hypothetical protein